MHFKLFSSFENQKYCLCRIRQLTPQGANLGSPQWVWPEMLALKSGDVYPFKPQHSVPELAHSVPSAFCCLRPSPTWRLHWETANLGALVRVRMVWDQAGERPRTPWAAQRPPPRPQGSCPAPASHVQQSRSLLSSRCFSLQAGYGT